MPVSKPAVLAAGIGHIVFENHGSEIHEGMLVRLPKGMSPDDFQAAVRKGSLFPEDAQDYSGPGLMSPEKKRGHVFILANNG